ncbi:MAG: HAMP domain-containing sensor histidine kinase [Bacteroidota bacterium]
MRPITDSFYAKLSAIFLILIIFLGGSFFYMGVQNSDKLLDETLQLVNRELADEMAVEFQPFLLDGIQKDSIQAKIAYLNGINPQVDIYLLGGTGMIKGYFPGEEPNAELEMTTVDTQPLLLFLEGASLPIVAEDPLNTAIKKPFSVSRIEIMGETDCFLYVILGGQQYDETAGMLRDSYIVRSSVIGLILILGATALVGLLLFRQLTRRLRRMTEAVTAFEQGQLERRIDISSSDEIGLLGVSFNQMADTLVANMDEIKRVDTLRRELVANVSHDLRSPLASIQGYLETIQQKADISDEERNRYFDVVLRNTTRLGTLISELFELSKLDAQDVQPSLEPVSIAELAQDLVMKFRPLAESKNIRISAQLPDQPIGLVHADIALMERAISNLIDNAIKHTPEGGEVLISPITKGNTVTVSISDSGEGIPEEHLTHIFDRFYQVDKSRSTGIGAGLGLSIAQKILALHGATLSVTSKHEQGTTFSFGLSPYTG